MCYYANGAWHPIEEEETGESDIDRMRSEIAKLRKLVGRLRDGSLHNHITRDIKPLGKCPACDHYHARELKKKLDFNEDGLRGMLLVDKNFESGLSIPNGAPIYVRETDSGWIGEWHHDQKSWGSHCFALNEDEFSILVRGDMKPRPVEEWLTDEDYEILRERD